MQFRQKFGEANVTSLVERVSRFTVFLRKSRPIMERLIRTLESLPATTRRSITFDRGTEFTDWPYLQAGLGAQTWFCDPQSPWQKGTVENTNRRARRWLSSEVDPLAVSDTLLAKDHGKDAMITLACRCYKVALKRELTIVIAAQSRMSRNRCCILCHSLWPCWYCTYWRPVRNVTRRFYARWRLLEHCHQC